MFTQLVPPSPVSPNGGFRGSRLRRVVIARSGNLYLDSSEALPSEHDSLYNGILVSFESSEEGCKITQPPLAVNMSSMQGKLCLKEVPVGHVTCTQVDGSDQATNRSAPSCTSTPRNPTAEAANAHPPCPGPKTRIFSFDDLDIPTSRPKFRTFVSPRTNRRPTSSSSGSFQSLTWLNEIASPVEPAQPIYPPPQRSPTPPGVPSFGSPEAVNFRLPRRASGLHSNSRRGQRQSTSNRSPDDPFTNSSGIDVVSSCLRSLRQFFAVHSSEHSFDLPPGAVARADDGTFIRGRFGNRLSGHGIGGGPTSGGLASHPFHSRNLPAAEVTPPPRRQGQRDGASRRPSFRNPPYASMLDVPVVNKRSRSIRFAMDNGGSQSQACPAGPISTTTPPTSQGAGGEYAPPVGYTSPVGMQLSTDGGNDDRDPQAQPQSGTPADSEGDETSGHCSCVNPTATLTARWSRLGRPPFPRWRAAKPSCQDSTGIPPQEGNGNNGANGVLANATSDPMPSPSEEPDTASPSFTQRVTEFLTSPLRPAWGWHPLSGRYY
jgi:hypothetical protein